MPGSEAAEPSRVAVRFKAASTHVKTVSRPLPKSSLGKRHRAHHALNAESDSDEGTQHHQGEHERITAFGDDGAETEDTSRLLLRRTQRGRLEASQLGVSSTAPQNGHPHGSGDGPLLEDGPAASEQPIKWGLTVAKRGTPVKHRTERNASPTRRDGQAVTTSKQSSRDGTNVDGEPDKVGATAVDDAILVGGRRLKLDSEADAFKRDTRGAAEESTTEDYDAMSEDFGMVMLRGMGWDGKLSEKVKQAERRPAHMGLGAKRLDGKEELGAWNQKGGSKGNHNSRSRLDDYRRDERKDKLRRGEKHPDSYKQERDREKLLGQTGSRHRHRHSQH